MCTDRQSPLLIGSVKSNLGHAEASAALVSIAKAVIVMDSGMIPPNLHYKVPNSQVPALSNGKFKVVCSTEKLPGDLVAVNAMSFSGAFGHVLLRRNNKVKRELLKDGILPEDELPRLILTSGRHIEGVKEISDSIRNMDFDAEFAALMNNIHKQDITGHMYRAFQIIPTSDEISGEIKEFDGKKQEIWFIFSGMGSQWNGMGTGLLKFPVFAAAIDKCDRILAPLGVDIKYVLTNMNHSVFENILNCFVGIAAVQIGLVDLLKSLDIVPDGFVGHSVGELGCAYADGCFTAEQMILSAYSRGKASLEASLVKGMMAAVGLGYKAIKDRLPENVQVACHNSEDSCTLSGPVDDVQTFVQQLKSEGIFARTVNVANIAYHSRCIAPAGPVLLKYLREVIKEPKPRTSRWISSSIAESDWNTPLAQFSSAEYHTNNLLSPVLFEEASRHVPANAIAIEIAPHGLLQAILRKSLLAYNIPLTNRSANCSVRYFLSAVGKMYLNNLHPDVNALYPAVEYPVSRGTPGIAHLVTWDHREIWASGREYRTVMIPGEEEIDFLNLDENRLELGHKIYNDVVFPVPLLLMYVWKRFLAVTRTSDTTLAPVEFQDVHIFKHLILPYLDQVKLNLAVQRASGKFEISIIDGKSFISIMHGRISLLDTNLERTMTNDTVSQTRQLHVIFSDFYDLIESRGYVLNDYYKAVNGMYIGESECSGHVLWDNDWLPFLDALLKVQVYLGMEKDDGVLIPTFIQKLTINTSRFTSFQGGATVPFRQCFKSNALQCGGVELVGVQLSNYAGQPAPSKLKMEKLKFVPHFDAGSEMSQFLSVALQVVSEANLSLWKNNVTRIVIYEVSDESDESKEVMVQQIQTVLNVQFNIEASIQSVLIQELKSLYLQARGTFHLIVTHSYLDECVEQFDSFDKVFFLASCSGKISLPDNTITPVLQHKFPNRSLVLFKKVVNLDKWNIVDGIESADWFLKLQAQVMQVENDRPIIVCWDYEAQVCVAQICKILAKEDYAHRLRCFFLLDKNAPRFSVNNPYYYKQLCQGLSVNVLSGGVWGSFRRVLMTGIQETFKGDVDVSTISLEGLDVKYLGINSRSNTEIGNKKCKVGHLEYSGVTENGEHVIGLAQFKEFNSEISPDSTLNWVVPQGWSLEEAATVPLAYTTAFYALALTAGLKPGETVLIHAGCSPMGEAALSIAIHMGGDVYTTVYNEQQAEALVKRFPILKPKQILKFNEGNFEINLLMLTKGCGVLVIVNSLDGSDLHSSLRCLANHGRFIELGETDMKRREKIGMQMFLGSRTVYGVATDNLFNANQDWKIKMRAMVQDGIKKGVVKPLQRKVFQRHQTDEILNCLKKGDRQEKVLLSMKQVHQPHKNKKQTMKCDPNKSYLIIGSKYGLWLELMEWLITRGARKLVIAFEKENMCSYAARKFNILVTRYKLTVVMTSATRADTEDGAVELLKETIQLGPLADIFHILLDDNSAKVKNLDSASRLLTPELPNFVCLFGGSATVCDARRQSGLPGLAIQWNLPLKKPKEVLNYLEQLIDYQDTRAGSQIVLVNDPVTYSNSFKVENLDCCTKVLQDYLPHKTELYDLGASLPLRPHFEEVATLCPRSKFGKCFNPVFLFPGLSVERFEALIRQLHYPAYCVTLPAVWQTVEETAQDLVTEILALKSNGPYTLVGETWCGALAIEVGRLLEACGHVVGLTLLDAAPAVTQNWVSMIGSSSNKRFGDILLYLLLDLNLNVKKDISKAKSWQEKLNCALKSEAEERRENMSNALTSIHTKLKTLSNFRPSGDLFQGEVLLVQQKGASSSDFCKLFLYCGENVKIYIVEDATSHSQLIASHDTATIINDNTIHSW